MLRDDELVTRDQSSVRVQALYISTHSMAIAQRLDVQEGEDFVALEELKGRDIA